MANGESQLSGEARRARRARRVASVLARRDRAGGSPGRVGPRRVAHARRRAPGLRRDLVLVDLPPRPRRANDRGGDRAPGGLARPRSLRGGDPPSRRRARRAIVGNRAARLSPASSSPTTARRPWRWPSSSRSSGTCCAEHQEKHSWLWRGYHGDTFGAMSIGAAGPFTEPFAPFTFEVARIPVPASAGDEAGSRAALEALATILGNRAASVAAVVTEPILQGAGGMRIHPASFLRGIRQLCDDANIPWIADEVLTGFGRTGAMFACEHARRRPGSIVPFEGDHGGVLPLAATLCREEVYQEFQSGRARARSSTATRSRRIRSPARRRSPRYRWHCAPRSSRGCALSASGRARA